MIAFDHRPFDHLQFNNFTLIPIARLKAGVDKSLNSKLSNRDWEVGQVNLILGPSLKAGAVVGSCEQAMGGESLKI